MSLVKSFATGLGDTYYIRHGSDNFTIIDCRIDAFRHDIIEEIREESRDKGVVRFISTHPDDDHVKGLARLDDALGLRNFYVVENRATKPEYTVDFERYCELRDDTDKAFYMQRGCTRRWMNQANEERSSSGINVLWPALSNPDFQNVLTSAEDGGSPNNLSTILKCSLENGVTMLWLGDLETDFMKTIEDEIELPETDIVFAAHHGRANALQVDGADGSEGRGPGGGPARTLGVLLRSRSHPTERHRRHHLRVRTGHDAYLR